jgi:hypothetical protein
MQGPNIMTRLQLRIGENPTPFDWQDIISAMYHNLGDRAAAPVIQFSIDSKAGHAVMDQSRPDYKNGLLVDLALYGEIAANYPAEDLEDLDDLMFVRAFCLGTTDMDEVSQWIYGLFRDEPLYVWVNGEMVGGICFPQGSDEEDRPPLKERLSNEVCRGTQQGAD